MITRLVETDAHEGPVYVAAEHALYFTTQRRAGRVDIRRLALADGRVSTVRADANVANGMALDHDGRLLVCEQRPAAIARVDPATGRRETVVHAYRGLPLNSPNDVVAKRDGTIWFTDPSYAHLQGFGPRPQLPDAVYRYDGEPALVAQGFGKPNGLAFSPDERVLYVGDSERDHLKAYDVLADGRLANERVFADVAGHPDGIAVDAAGRVYTTAAGGIAVFDPTGEPAGEIALPGAVNLTFAGPDLCVTADTAIWIVHIERGAAPWDSSALAR